MDRFLGALECTTPGPQSAVVDANGWTWIATLNERHVSIRFGMASKDGSRMLVLNDSKGMQIVSTILSVDVSSEWANKIRRVIVDSYN